MTDIHELVEDLYAHLEATEQRPVEARANQWLGEAQAVVADARIAPESVVKKRVSQADELLSHVEGTGDSEADEHVEHARELATEILSRLD